MTRMRAIIYQLENYRKITYFDVITTGSIIRLVRHIE